MVVTVRAPYALAQPRSTSHLHTRNHQITSGRLARAEVSVCLSASLRSERSPHDSAAPVERIILVATGAASVLPLHSQLLEIIIVITNNQRKAAERSLPPQSGPGWRLPLTLVPPIPGVERVLQSMLPRNQRHVIVYAVNTNLPAPPLP
ncbi:hypothetical protein KC347_g86 [Hortaea werneckii]|nr:hypothetical protein KC347_g86 [Hortaea werneckii]